MSLNPQHLLAVLATVLYHIDDVVKEKIKTDDSGQSLDVEHQVIEIVAQKDMVMCIVPLQILNHYAEHPYRFEFQVRKEERTDRSLGVFGFEKVKNTGPTLVSMDGKPISVNSGVNKMFEDFFNPPKKEVKTDA